MWSALGCPDRATLGVALPGTGNMGPVWEPARDSHHLRGRRRTPPDQANTLDDVLSCHRSHGPALGSFRRPLLDRTLVACEALQDLFPAATARHHPKPVSPP